MTRGCLVIIRYFERIEFKLKSKYWTTDKIYYKL